MGGKSKSQTVGFRYYMGLHFGLCHGPVDQVRRVKIGDREAWAGSVTSNATISVNAPNLFGGDSKEGGVVGGLDVMMGGATQPANAYLQSRISPNVPAFRGILSAVFKAGLVSANNPYVKPWAFTVKRILQGWTGGSAWYPEKAEIQIAEGSPKVIAEAITIDARPVSSGGNSGNGPANSNPVVFTTLDALSTYAIEFVNTGPNLALSPYAPGAPQLPGQEWFCIVSASYNGSSTPNTLGNNTGYPTALQAYNASVGQQYTFTGANSVAFYLNDASPGDNRGSVTFRLIKLPPTKAAMNPAHIIYQCLTDTAWGMGYPTTAIDTTTFTAAADTLFAEGFGLCMVWNQQDTIDSFIGVVLDHVGGILYVDPTTGKFALKLIRADYNRATLPIYGPSNLVSASDYQRQAWGETVNEITTVFTDFTSEKAASVTMQDLANIQTQGAVVAQTRQYPGIHTQNLARRVAARDLNIAATPLSRVRLAASRKAWNIIPGGVFRLTWPDLGIYDVVFRVLEVNRGTLQNGTITIDAVEDVFGLPANTYGGDQDPGWIDPVNLPAASPARKLIEAPYWDLVRNLTAAELDYIDPLSGYLQTLAIRPSGDALNYAIQTKVGAAAYEERAIGDFCPTATITAAISKTTTAIAIGSGVNLDLVELGTYAVIGDEVIGISAIDATLGTATITRGLLDTVPADHAAGARIYFADGFQGVDTTEYATGEVVDVKILPRTGLGELAVAAAPSDSITMARRHNRPYPPGLFRISGQAYPVELVGVALSATWAHRDRLQQTASLITQGAGNIGPEAGTTYNVRLYDNHSGALLASQTGISGTSWTGPTLPGVYTLRIEVESQRDGIVSWQPQRHVFDYISDARLIEDTIDYRITEAGEIRSQE